MLSELFIKNFAIIEDLRISFSEGLTILSGETGAGKSIIIDAIDLLLGGRATSKLIRTGAESAEIEALFQISIDSKTAAAMITYGYDPSEGLIIRRIIARNERHKTYINGRLSTIQILTNLTENLASISGQHAHQGLLKEDQHLFILDQFAGLSPLRSKVYKSYHEILPEIYKLNELKLAQENQVEQIRTLEFQKREIVDANITISEDVVLEQEKVKLKNAQTLFLIAHKALNVIYSAKGAIIEQLADIKKKLEKASEIDPFLSPKVEDIGDAIIKLEDIAFTLRDYEQTVQVDERRLSEIEDRIDMLRKLKRKYGGSLEAVLNQLNEIENKLLQVESISDKIVEIETNIKELNKKLISLCENLSEKRKAGSILLSKKVEKELSFLKMANTIFQVTLKQVSVDKNSSPYLSKNNNIITENGLDQSAFMIATNVGEPLKQLADIASGGELSRVVLALKVILSETDSVETIIFDEVDAGIGGDVAELVGQKLSILSKYHQVICITHLAQIAKFGDNHFKISKRVSDGRTTTSITPLDESERVKEIARMLGGIKITQTTIEHAREMLEGGN
ncbi:MAG: DNA repair protein RecN [Desulfobacterales bacterium]|nr:DNA repair protein RecN [Desulfobacterales bacterium]MBF0395472.1 DNA repair protein RecN [Desulfobacterales bacterium]